MRKTIAVIVVLLLILLGVAPYITGYFFKKHYLDVIANLNREQSYKVEMVHYESGWLGADAELRITFPKATEKLKSVAPGTNLAFTIHQNITHGPLIHNPINNGYTIAMVGVRSKLHIPENVEALVLTATEAEKGFIMVNSLVTFGGECFNRLQMPVLSLPNGMPAKATWQGINGDVNVTVKDNIISRVQSNLTIGAFNIRIDDQSFILPALELMTQPMTVTGDSARLTSGLWEGNSTLLMPSVMVKDPSGPKFGVENFKFTSLSKSEANNFYNISSALSVQKVDLTAFGLPNIAPATITTTMNHMNAKELVNVVHMANSMQGSSAEQEKEYLALLPRLVTPSTTINEDIYINTSYGAFTLKGLASWPANATLPISMDDIIDKANATVTIRAAIPLVNQLIEQSAQGMAQDAAKEANASSMPPAPEPTPQTPSTPVNNASPSDSNQVASKQRFDQQMAELVRLGKLPLAQAIQVMDVAAQRPPIDVFTSNIKSFSLNPEVEQQVIQFYTQMNTVPNQPAPVQTVTPQVPPTPAVQAAVTADPAQMQQMISNSGKAQLEQWIKEGYITQEQNDYVVIITRENGVFKINGKDLPPELALPTQPGATMPAIPAPTTAPTMPTATPTVP